MQSDWRRHSKSWERNVLNNTKNLLWKCWATHIPVVSPAKRQLAKEKHSRPVILLWRLLFPLWCLYLFPEAWNKPFTHRSSAVANVSQIVATGIKGSLLGSDQRSSPATILSLTAVCVSCVNPSSYSFESVVLSKGSCPHCSLLEARVIKMLFCSFVASMPLLKDRLWLFWSTYCQFISQKDEGGHPWVMMWSWMQHRCAPTFSFSVL